MKSKYANVLTSLAVIAMMLTSIPTAFGQSPPQAHFSGVLPLADVACSSFEFLTGTIGTPDDGDAATNGPDVVIFPIRGEIDTDFDNAYSTNPSIGAASEPEANDLQYQLMYDPDGLGGVPQTVAGLILDDVELNPQSVIIDAAFGSGDPVTFSITGSAKFITGPNNMAAVGGGSIIGTPAAGTLTWEKRSEDPGPDPFPPGIITGEPDSTCTPGSGFLVGFNWVDGSDGGQIGGAENLVWLPGIEATAEAAEGFLIRTPVVGGFSMGVDTTSLLVAGVQTNALWILPILGLAGTVIAIRKLKA